MRSTAGFKYLSQLTRMCVNLSKPANKGPNPKATRRAQYAALSCLETSIDCPPNLIGRFLHKKVELGRCRGGLRKCKWLGIAEDSPSPSGRGQGEGLKIWKRLATLTRRFAPTSPKVRGGSPQFRFIRAFNKRPQTVLPRHFLKKLVLKRGGSSSSAFAVTNLLDRSINNLCLPRRIADKLQILLRLAFGKASASSGRVHERGNMKTLIIGLVITIVFLATCWVNTMHQAW